MRYAMVLVVVLAGCAARKTSADEYREAHAARQRQITEANERDRARMEAAPPVVASEPVADPEPPTAFYCHSGDEKYGSCEGSPSLCLAALYMSGAERCFPRPEAWCFDRGERNLRNVTTTCFVTSDGCRAGRDRDVARFHPPEIWNFSDCVLVLAPRYDVSVAQSMLDAEMKISADRERAREK
jgi:hypothetical protein